MNSPSADVRDFTSEFVIPAGNSLPDLHISALDPLGYLNDQHDARDSNSSGTVATLASAVSTDTGAAVSTGSHFGFPSVQEWKDAFKGFAKTTAVIVVGIILIALGAYQLTKD